MTKIEIKRVINDNFKIKLCFSNISVVGIQTLRIMLKKTDGVLILITVVCFYWQLKNHWGNFMTTLYVVVFKKITFLFRLIKR